MSSGPGSPIRILIVDDAEILRRGIIRFLSGEPRFSVAGEAASIREMLDTVAATKPDVILMDLHIPGEAFFDAKLLQTELKGITVICMSAWVDGGTRAMAHKWGCPIVDKSDLITELIPTIDAALKQKQAP